MDYKRIFEELLNIEIKTASNQVKVLCPFHSDKKPSLSLNLSEGKWYCHACGEGGRVYSLAKKLGYKIDSFGNITPLSSDNTEPEKQDNPKPQPKLQQKSYTVDDYAREKKLDKEFLQTVFEITDNDKELVIPYKDENDEIIYYKYRSHNKKMWVEKGIKLMPYGLWLLKDADKDFIYIVEGESDTQTLWQNGIPALGIPGASALTEEMLDYIYDFKKWYFVIENDKGGETFLENIFQIVNDYFDEKVGDSYVVLMSDAEKKDINDLWKVSRKKDRFLRRLGIITSLSVNLRVAYKTIIKGEKMFDKDVRLISKDVYSKLQCLYDEEGVLWNYDPSKKIYRIVKNEDEFLKNIIIQHGVNKPTKISQVANQIKTFIAKQRKLPKAPLQWIHFNNISVNFETLETKEFNPSEWFIENKIPFNYNPDVGKTNDKVDELFNDWVEDPEKLFGLIGYSFVRGYPENKIFILYGIGGNGKSTFLNLLTNILNGLNGELDQTASASLDDLLVDRFSYSLLYGKLANLSGEMPYTRIMNSTRLKDLTGEQRITAQYKFGKQFEFKNYAKLIFATNKVPATQDTSKGWFRRIVLIEFKSLPDDKKRYDILSTLTQKDYEYIIYRSILALNKYAKKRFEFSSIAETKAKYLDLSNPLRYYIRNNCIITHDQNDWIESGLFINKFKKWLSITSQPTMSWKEISDELTELGLERGRAKDYTGKQVRVIFGIRWATGEEENIDEIPF